MMLVALPPPPALEEMLQTLFGRPVRVELRREPPPRWPVVLARYVGEEPGLAVHLLCDLPLGCALAAALSMIPAETAAAAAAAATLDEPLRQNLAEVLNVVAHYISMGGRRFGLLDVAFPPQEQVPASFAEAIASDERRILAVGIEGYGGGQLAFCTV